MSVQRRLILAVVTDVNQSVVAYPSCTQCYTKLLIDPTTQRYHCIKCSISIPSQTVQWRYRLVLTIADDTAICRVVVFGRTLDPFFGKTATDFYRSLTNLGNSGYPSEALLSDALMKTFHGKYFYFGLKLLGCLNSKTEPTLSDVTEKQSWNMESQSALNSTDMLEQSHVLVYQMIASNDGVYATVTDFIRSSIKQLRGIETPCRREVGSINKGSVSLRDNSTRSIDNGDSTLYTPSSFHGKQKSVAFSFETSSDDSSVFSSKGHVLSVGNNHIRAVSNESRTSAKHVLCSNHESVTKSSTDIRHENWKTALNFNEDEHYTFENGLLGHENDELKASFRIKGSSLHANRIKSLPEFSPSIGSIAQTLDFNNLTDNGEHESTSQRIDQELKKRVIKQHISLIKQRTLSQSSIKSGPVRKESIKRINSTDVIKKVTPKAELTRVLKQKLLTDHVVHDTQGKSTCLANSQSYSENQFQDQSVSKCHDKFQVSQINDLDNDGDLEQFMNMPDSEGLQTFLGDEQQVIWDESNIKHNIETARLSSYMSGEQLASEIKVTEKSDTEQCLDIHTTSTAKLKDIVHLKENMPRENKTAKDFLDCNELKLPDSEELEAFLETFNDGLSLADESCPCETGEQNSQEDTPCDYTDTGIATPNKNISFDTKSKESKCDSKLLQETQIIDKSKSNQGGDHDIEFNKFDGLRVTSEDEGNKKQTLLNHTNKEETDLNIVPLPDSEELEAFLETFDEGLSLSDNHDSDASEINNMDSYEKDLTHSPTSKTGFHLTPNIAPTTINQSKKTNDVTGNNSDSGLQLSTSSVDLFASFDSTTDSPVNNTASKLCKIENVKDSIIDGTTEDASGGSHKLNNQEGGTFEDSWSQIQDDELEENLLEELNHCLENTSNICNQEKEVGNTKNAIVYLSHVRLCSDYENDNTLSGESMMKQSPEHRESTYESSFDSSDILFDTPEPFVPQRRIFTKPVSSYLSKNLHSTSQQSSNSLFTSSSDKGMDGGVICESQSSQSCSDEQNRLGDLKQNRKVIFSKKLRRVSSCRLMDIKMKENRSPLFGVVTNPKPCLKSCRKQTETLVNVRTRESLTKLSATDSLVSDSLVLSPTNDEASQSPKGSNSTPKTENVNKQTETLVNDRRRELLTKQSATDRLVSDSQVLSQTKTEDVNKQTETLVDDRTIESLTKLSVPDLNTIVNDSYIIESSQSPKESNSMPRTIDGNKVSVSKSQQNGMRVGVESAMPLRCTPDFWESSFEDSIMDSSIDKSSDFNTAIALDTPDRIGDSVLSEKCFNSANITCRPEDKSKMCSVKTKDKFPITSKVICVDSPDMFSQFANPASITRTAKTNDENVNSNQVVQDRAFNGTNRKVFNRLVINTHDCDNLVIEKCSQSVGKENDFSPDDNISCKNDNDFSPDNIDNDFSPDNIVASKNDNDFSPDLFGDDSFEGCDIESELCNVPSVLCKQLFF